jgi:hypothetical protein
MSENHGIHSSWGDMRGISIEKLSNAMKNLERSGGGPEFYAFK